MRELLNQSAARGRRPLTESCMRSMVRRAAVNVGRHSPRSARAGPPHLSRKSINCNQEEPASVHYNETARTRRRTHSLPTYREVTIHRGSFEAMEKIKEVGDVA